MGKFTMGRQVIEGLLKASKEAAEAAKVVEPEAKAVEATRPWRTLSEAEQKAAREGSRSRIGVRQRELDALKGQTIRRSEIPGMSGSGQKGWQELTGEYRARLQEGGEFPLRTSIQPKAGGGGPIRYTERDVYGKAPSAERTSEITEGVLKRARGEKLSTVAPKDLETMKEAVRNTQAERATNRELRAGRIISGRTPVGREAESAKEAARVSVETGEARRGFGNISAGTNPSGSPKGALSEAEKLRRGIQSGAIRGAVGAAGGYAANEMFDTYAGPRDSGRTPQVQWGRNRQ